MLRPIRFQCFVEFVLQLVYLVYIRTADHVYTQFQLAQNSTWNSPFGTQLLQRGAPVFRYTHSSKHRSQHTNSVISFLLQLEGMIQQTLCTAAVVYRVLTM